jgi:hypothetical protein
VREVPIENFATTAPRADFVANADISEELAAGVESATIFVSTDGQTQKSLHFLLQQPTPLIYLHWQQNQPWGPWLQNFQLGPLSPEILGRLFLLTWH